jgi:anti-sigma factor RsiW
MHEPVRSQLEEILQGRLRAGQNEAVGLHLAQCAACAEELRGMRLSAGLIRTLRVAETPEPAAGFYARVLHRVEMQGKPSFWNLLLDPVFGRRLVYATGSMLLLMASFLLATSGGKPELAQTPVEMIAQPASAAAGFSEDVRHEREYFLTTMASFSE